MATKRQCTASTKAGSPCQAWAVPGTDPPRCAAHAGKPGGAPPGNQNATTHGLYARTDLQPCESIDDVIADLAAKQARLSAYIDTCMLDPDVSPDTIARLLSLHAQTASRLGRLLRDRAILTGGQSDELQAAINAALDELGPQLGIDL